MAVNNNNPWAADLLKTQAEIKQNLANIAKFESQLAADPGNVTLIRQLESARLHQNDLQIEYNLFLTEYNAVESRATASSGAIIGNANLARDENATSQLPSQGLQVLTPEKRIGPPDSGAGTNAQVTPTTETNPTEGTDAPVRPTSQTQATPTTYNNNGALTQAQLAALQQAPGSGSSYRPPTAPQGGPGAGAPGDNNTPTNPSVLVNRLDALYAAKNNFIKERPNVLDDYFSYTYSLSWYLVTPVAFNQTISNIKKNLNGYFLLAQSGGAGSQTGNIQTFYENNGVASTTGLPIGAQRNQFFNLDYYIDNLTIETAYNSSVASGGPIAIKNISFTVSEPNGVTLPLNLYRAVNEVYTQYQLQSPKGYFVNYASGLYCMVIRFYGYNEQGQLQQPIKNTSSTDPNAAVEKFVFYSQTSLAYSVSSKLTEYRITGAAPSTNIGFSVNRGSIPFNMQFTGTTVKDVLVGQIKQQTASNAAGDNTRNGVPIKTQAARAAGTDPNAVNDQGMAFGGGGL